MTKPSVSRREAWYVVSLLCLLIVDSALDRLIVSLLVGPLRRDIGMTDTQIGLIFGSAFAFFYGIVGLPIARLVDIGNRKRLIVIGVTLWSLATFASGLAQDAWTLAGLRIGLALGEAVLTPAAISLIGDLFPADKRSFPTSVFLTATMFGAYGCYLIGGAVLAGLGETGTVMVPYIGPIAVWRLVFFCVGTPGIFIALLVQTTVREAARMDGGHRASLSQVLHRFTGQARLYCGLFFGVGVNLAIGYSFGSWIVAFLERRYGWTASFGGTMFGMIGLVSSMSGALLVPALAQILRRRGIADALLITAIGVEFLSAVSAACGILQSNPWATLILLGPMIFGITGGSTLVTIMIHDIVPANMRGAFMAIVVLCGSAAGMALGPALTAYLSEHVFHGPDALRWALATVPAVVMPVSLALLLYARPPFIQQSKSRQF